MTTTTVVVDDDRSVSGKDDGQEGKLGFETVAFDRHGRRCHQSCSIHGWVLEIMVPKEETWIVVADVAFGVVVVVVAVAAAPSAWLVFGSSSSSSCDWHSPGRMLLLLLQWV